LKQQIMRKIRILIKPYYLFIAPAIIYILLVTLYPVVYGFLLSLTNIKYNRKGGSFIGIANYIQLIKWDLLPVVLVNSFIFTVGVVGISVILGLCVALALNRIQTARTAIRTLLMSPWVLPTVLVGLIFRMMFDSSKMGIINSIILLLGFKQIRWFASPMLAMMVIILSFSWKGVAFASVFLLAALQTVDEELYEQGKIDGTSPWQSLRYITLPLIRPQLTIVLILLTVGTLNEVDIIMSVTSGGPGRATETLAMTIYREAFTFYNASFGAAISMFLLLLNLLLTVFYFFILRQRGQLTID